MYLPHLAGVDYIVTENYCDIQTESGNKMCAVNIVVSTSYSNNLI